MSAAGQRRMRVLGTALITVVLITMLLTSLALAATTTIRVANFWGPYEEGYEAMVEAFTKAHPDIVVELESGWDNMDKVAVAVAGGTAPDVILNWNIKQLAHNNILQPLDVYVAREQLSPSDFVPSVWKRGQYDAKTYGMGLFTDVGGMVYNQQLFLEAGLDPDSPPRTIENLDTMYPKLTRENSDGTMVQIAHIPWDILYVDFNMLNWWTLAFGGSLWESTETEVPTFTDPQVMKALAWVKSKIDRYRDRIPGDWGEFEQRFVNGNEAIIFHTLGGAKNVMDQHPDLGAAIALPPHQASETDHFRYYTSSFLMGITASSKNPDAAWEFIKFATASKEGSAVFSEIAGQFPVYLESPAFEWIGRDPVMSVLVPMIVEGDGIYPPGDSVFGGKAVGILHEALGPVLDGTAVPESQLEIAQKQMEALIRDALAKE